MGCSDTALAHAGCSVDPTTGALTPPIHFSSTFEREKDLSYPKGYLYSRIDNPTRRLLETTLASLEDGAAAASFASGQAAAAAVLTAVPQGHIILADDVYHGIRSLLQGSFQDWGLSYTEVFFFTLSSRLPLRVNAVPDHLR